MEEEDTKDCLVSASNPVKTFFFHHSSFIIETNSIWRAGILAQGLAVHSQWKVIAKWWLSCIKYNTSAAWLTENEQNGVPAAYPTQHPSLLIWGFLSTEKFIFPWICFHLVLLETTTVSSGGPAPALFPPCLAPKSKVWTAPPVPVPWDSWMPAKLSA